MATFLHGNFTTELESLFPMFGIFLENNKVADVVK